jgi:hypothetical protein
MPTRSIAAALLLSLAPLVSAQPIPASAPVGAMSETVDVWVWLTEPGLAGLPADASAEERDTRRARIVAQQDAVMALLRALGGLELARVMTTQSAIAVRLPRRQLDAARRIDGVQSVGPARDRLREPPVGPVR